MNQLWHIFRKDFRRHWPEALVSLSLLVAFAVTQPHTWTGEPFNQRILDGFLKFLPFFMVVSWAFLIVRLVQGEPLVGDRLFWVTRPYRWQALLGAKILSVILFFHLPLFVVQLILLKIAEFPVASSVSGLISTHLALDVLLVLPCFAIAAITSSVGQACIAFFLLLLPLIGVGLLALVIPEMEFGGGDVGGSAVLLFMLAAPAAVFLQYLYRRIRVGRLVLFGAMVLIFLGFLAAPYRLLISRSYPLPTQSHPLPAVFALDPELSFAHPGGQKPTSWGDDVFLEIPVNVSDLSEKTIVELKGVRLDLVLPDGTQWTSHWQNSSGNVTPGRTRIWPTLKMKKSLFNDIKDRKVSARLSLAFSVFDLRPETRASLTFSHNRLSLPEGGRCINDPGDKGNWLKCFAALKEPKPILITADLPNDSCAVVPDANREPWAPSSAFYANLGGDSSEPGFTPIHEFNIALSRFLASEDQPIRLPVCPETQLHAYRPKSLYTARTEIDLGDIVLLNYLPSYPRKFSTPPKHQLPHPKPDSLSQIRPGPSVAPDSD